MLPMSPLSISALYLMAILHWVRPLRPMRPPRPHPRPHPDQPRCPRSGRHVHLGPPHHPARSTIITSDKSAGHLFVYGLDGSLIQTANVGKPGNIDIRNGFPLGGREVSIVAFNERNDLKVHIYAVDPETRTITRVDDDAIQTGMNYGLTLYRSPRDGAFYAITVPNDTGGFVERYRLDVSGDDAVSGTKVRNWPITESEGCAADDQTGTLYIGEEKVGIWRVGANPPTPRPANWSTPWARTALPPTSKAPPSSTERATTGTSSPPARAAAASSSTGATRKLLRDVLRGRRRHRHRRHRRFARQFRRPVPRRRIHPPQRRQGPHPVLVGDLRGLGLPLE